MPRFTNAAQRKRGLDILLLLEHRPCCHGWIWGLPTGWEAEAPALRRFIRETDGIEVIESTMVICVHQLDKDEAEELIGLLRWPLHIFITCWGRQHFLEQGNRFDAWTYSRAG